MGRRSYEEILKIMEEKYGIVKDEGLKIIKKKRNGEELRREELVAYYDNPDIGKLKIPYDVANNLLWRFARKYTTNLLIKNVDEMYSELLEHLLIKTPDNVNLAAVILENEAKSIYKRIKKEQEKEILINISSESSGEDEEPTEIKLIRLGCNESLFNQKEFDDADSSDLEDIVLSIMEKIRINCKPKDAERINTVIVVMGYLNGHIDFLEDAYYKLENELSEEKYEQLYDFMKQNKIVSRDIVYKVFLGINSGINSGSSYKIKDGLEIFKKELLQIMSNIA